MQVDDRKPRSVTDYLDDAIEVVKKIYPSSGRQDDYMPMIQAFGRPIIFVEDTGYSGDTRVLLDTRASSDPLYIAGEIAWLQIGWGSCPGCDALQGCNGARDIATLMLELKNDMKVFENKREALKFFKEHDWKGDYSWHHPKQHAFVAAVIAFLEIDVGPFDY